MMRQSSSSRRNVGVLVAQRKGKNRAALCAAVERLEPRMLMTGTYSAQNLSGLLALLGMNKNGSLTFDSTSLVTAGGWTNQSGPPATDVVGPSTYTVSAGGQVSLSLTTVPANATTSTSTTLVGGVINGTRDVVALNEMAAGVPVAGGLDLLVSASGSYTLANLAGTWNIAAQDFRGSVTINALGVITGGSVYIESTQKTANILNGGTAVVNASGTGTLTFTTALATTSSFHSQTLAFTMNGSHDVMVGNSQALGNGTASAELAVLLKNSGTYATSDVVGTNWNFNSALGVGTMSFLASHVVTATVTTPTGDVQFMTGTYVLGGNGSITVNVSVLTRGGGVGSFTESFTGVLNQHKNMIAMDRAIANGRLDSSLIVLTNPGNHVPTEKAVATWPTAAVQITPMTFTYNTLVGSTVADVHDLDGDTLKLKITAEGSTSNTFTITHNGTTSAVVLGTTEMVQGDTLTWTPGSASGLVNAFTIQADDGTGLAANGTKIFVNTGLLPAVSAVATHGNALEALAGNSKGAGTIVLTRVGGDLTAPLTVTVQIGGTAVNAVNYTLVGSNGSLSGSTATVTFPAKAKTITLTVLPIEDHVVDPTRTVLVSVVADPNGVTPAYIPGAHAQATVNVLDSNPTIVIVPAGPAVRDGGTHQKAFFVERLPAQGGSLANVTTTVNITYSGTQNAYSGSLNVANDLPAGLIDNATTVTFTSNEVKKVIFLSPGEDGVAATEHITATLSSSTSSYFIPAGQGSATVSVTDDAPKVRVMTLIATGQEGATQSGFAEFRVIRDGNNTASALTVAFTTAGSAVKGTNYKLVLASDTTHTLTSTVTIPAGSHSVDVELIPLDDGLNDGNLTAAVTVVADATPSYHLGNGLTSTMKIINNNRFPTVGHATFSANTTHSTAIQFSYAALQTATGDILAVGSNGTLQFEVGKVLSGQVLIKHGSGGFVAAGAKTVVSSGDTLEWVPPAGLVAANVSAFTLFGLDGNLLSLSSSLAQVTLT